MIKFHKGIPIQPVTRVELYDEIIRLQNVLKDAEKTLRRIRPAEADVVKIAIEREVEYTQPEVGPQTISNHFYTNPANAGCFNPDE